MVSGIMPGRHQVVQGRLDVQVQPAFGPPQLGRVHQRGVTAGPDGQAHQGIAEVTGTGDRHLGRRGQPRPGQAGPPRRAGCRTGSCRSARRRTSSRVTASHPAWQAASPVSPPRRRTPGQVRPAAPGGGHAPRRLSTNAAAAGSPLVAGVRSPAASRVTSMNVSSSATCRGGSAAGRVPGVRANSLMGCACAGLTGWSWGMRVKLAWLWRWRVRRPAWLMIIWNTPASAIPCSLATVAQEAPEPTQAAEPARGLSLVGRSQRLVRPAATGRGLGPPPAGWASWWRGRSWRRRVPT